MPKGDWNDRSLQGNKADNVHLQLAIGMDHNNNMGIEARLAVIPSYDWTHIEPLPGAVDFWKRFKEQM